MFLSSENVLMAVRVRDGIGDTVLRIGMRVLMGVLADQRIINSETRTDDHHRKGDKIAHRQALVQQNEGQKSADKRGDRVISGSLSRAEGLLRTDIGEDAQSVSDKAEQQRKRNILYLRKTLADDQRDDQ